MAAVTSTGSSTQQGLGPPWGDKNHDLTHASGGAAADHLPPPQEEKEKRRLEQLERKKETQRLLEEEDSKLKGGKAPRVAAPSKVTRAQIEETLRRDHQHKEAPDPGGALAHSGAASLPTKGRAAGLTPAESGAPSSPPEQPPGLCGDAGVGSVLAGLALSVESMRTNACVFACSALDLAFVP